MTVTLSQHAADALAEQVRAGHWASMEEALEAAVGMLVLSVRTEDTDWLMQNRDAVRDAVEESLAAEARGEWCHADELDARFAEYRARRSVRAA